MTDERNNDSEDRAPRRLDDEIDALDDAQADADPVDASDAPGAEVGLGDVDDADARTGVDASAVPAGTDGEDSEGASAALDTQPATGEDAEPDPQPQVIVRQGAGRGIAILALVLVLLIFGALGAGAWFVVREGEDPLAYLPSARLEALEADLASAERELADAQRANRDALDREAELRRGMDALGSAFTELSAVITGEAPIDDEQWRIAETAYLLRVANLRASTEGDWRGAEALLLAADELLGEIDDLGLSPVRAAISDAVFALRAAPAVDRVGLYLEIESLTDRIIDLRPDERRFRAPDAPEEAEPNIVTRLRERLAGLVDFRVHRPAPVRPLVAPDESAFLRHNLALGLEQAQLALLQKDQVVWEASLREARRWVVDYFDPDDPVVQALDESLERLAGEQVRAQAPDISEPHTLLLQLRGRAQFLLPETRP